jgi:hypothetical protein
MSYYILPKNNNNIIVEPYNDNDTECLPFVSLSIYNYYTQISNEINLICENKNEEHDDTSCNTIVELIKVINPYEYIFSRVPGSKFSVSKLKPQSNLFYDFLEIVITLNIFDSFKSQNINTLHISSYYEDSIECSEMLRENFCDETIFFRKNEEENFKYLTERNIDFIFFFRTISNLLSNS